MSSLSQRIIRMLKVEVYLFGGEPERPNPVYGNDAHQNVRVRNTRTCNANARLARSGGGKVIEELIYDANGEITISPK